MSAGVKTVLAGLALFAGLSLFLILPCTPGYCQIKNANAQGTPGADQQSTIDALNKLLLESTVQHVNYESTIAAYQAAFAGGHSPAQTPVQPIGLPFQDNFTDNYNGWNTLTQTAGRASVRAGKLHFNINPNFTLWELIPNLTVGDSFYVEVTVLSDFTPCNSFCGSAGFCLGNFGTDQWHTFRASPNWVGFHDVLKKDQGILVNSTHDGQFDPSKPITLGLEANGGVFTFYVNGQDTDAYQIIPYGHQLGLCYTNVSGNNGTAEFSALSVRAAR